MCSLIPKRVSRIDPMVKYNSMSSEASAAIARLCVYVGNWVEQIP